MPNLSYHVVISDPDGVVIDEQVVVDTDDWTDERAQWTPQAGAVIPYPGDRKFYAMAAANSQAHEVCPWDCDHCRG